MGLLAGPCALLMLPFLDFFLDVHNAQADAYHMLLGRNTSIFLVVLAVLCALGGLAGTAFSILHWRRLIRIAPWLLLGSCALAPLLAKGAVLIAIGNHERLLRPTGADPAPPPGPRPQAAPAPEATALPASTGLDNGDMEWGDRGWREDAWRPGCRFLVDAKAARGGRVCLALVSEAPNDVRWLQEVAVEPHQDYVLSGWIRTRDVMPSREPVQAGAHLGLFMREERTAPLFGTQPWQRVELRFNSGADPRITVACRLGFFSGTVTGTAWFDDLRLEKR